MSRWKETTNERQSAVMGLIYHPLRNKAFDRLFIQLRQKKQGTCIPKKEILRYLAKYRKEQRMSLFGYIADQNPKWENIHLWLPFLNHDTPVFTGAERIVRKMNNAVFYVDMERPERGKYICTFKRMSDAPGQLEEYELTRQFFQMLEETIRRAPQYYLWTHNRWKRTHEEYLRRNEHEGTGVRE
jgi:KDO2-lipid IV(A) lauroyltransferase